MLLAGKKLNFGEPLTMSQKRYLIQRVGSLARHLQARGYKVNLTPAIRTDSVYLVVGKAEISFRNHAGGQHQHDYNVFLSSFPSWKEAKNHVLTTIIPKLPAPIQTVHETDVWTVDQPQGSRAFPVMDDEQIEDLEQLRKNIHALISFIQPISHSTMTKKQKEELKETITQAHSNYDKYRHKIKPLMPSS